MSRRAGVVVALGVALFARAASATEVPSGIYDAATWTAAGSPYLIMGDVEFDQLTIEAGTTVLFSSTNTAANRLINFSVTTLVVNGAPGSPVTFQPETATTSFSGWQGIWVRGSAAITGAIIRNANDGIALFSNHGPRAVSTISRTVFDTSAYVLMVYAGDALVDSITATNVGHGIVNQNTGSVQVTNSVLRANATLIYSRGGSVFVFNCTLDQGQTGIEFDPSSPSSSMNIWNTIVTNGGTGVRSIKTSGTEDATLTITNSDVWGNTSNFQDVTPGAGTISVDPRYVSAVDLHLRATSPCIDSGSAMNALNHDLDFAARPKGARVDMGAYEYDPAGGTGGTGGAGGGRGGTGDGAGAGGGAGAGSAGSAGAGAGTAGSGGAGAGGDVGQGGGGGNGGSGGSGGSGPGGGSAGSGGRGGTPGGSAGRGGVSGGSDAGISQPLSMRKSGCTDCGIGARSDGASAVCWTFVFMLTTWWRGRRRTRARRLSRSGD